MAKRRTIANAFRNLSIKQKWFLSCFLLTVLPFSLFITMNYIKSSNDLKLKLLFSARQAFDQTVSFIEYRITDIVNISDVIVADNRVQEIAGRPASYYATSRTDELTDYHYLYDLFTNLQSKTDVARIRLYLDNGASYTEGNPNFYNLRSVQGKLWFATLFNEVKKVVWFPDSYFATDPDAKDHYVSALRRLPDLNDFSKTVGVLSVDMKDSVLRGMLDKTKITPATVVYLVNDRNEIISSSGALTDGLDKFVRSGLAQLSANNSDDKGMVPVVIGNETYYTHVRMIDHTDWSMVLLLPIRDIVHETAQSRNEFILFFGIFSILAFLVALLIASSHSKRIRRLIAAMKQVESGNSKIVLHPGSNDEIGVLINKFHFLLTQIGSLFEEKYQMGLNAKSAELKALQSQINPHFLYNTLDLINHASIQSGNPNITHLVMTLSKYYKLSLGQGEDIVTVQSEIEHVQAYVEIQNSRFEHGIHLEVMIDPQMLDCKIPKITLQPLVENAIIHGILEKEVPTGTIRIEGNLKSEQYVITIHDDGVGISAERLSGIFATGGSSTTNSGYGVRNIHERLQLYFGPASGLSYTCTPGIGTTVQLVLCVGTI